MNILNHFWTLSQKESTYKQSEGVVHPESYQKRTVSDRSQDKLGLSSEDNIHACGIVCDLLCSLSLCLSDKNACL